MIGNKGQVLSIIIFFGLIVATFIFAIVIMNLTNSVLTPFSASMGNVSTQAGSNVTFIKNTFVTWWDWTIMFFFVLNLLLLFISAFMVDVHPAFIVLYILTCLFLVIFGYSMIEATNRIFESSSMLTSAGLLPMTNWVQDNFNYVMLGIMILSGIVMYAKVKMFGGTNY